MTVPAGEGAAPPTRKIRVLMVCLGNICRSPTAHGVLQNRIDNQGIAHLIEVDSAGTAAHHIGEPPDSRSIAAAAQRGYDLSAQRARKLCAEDFQRFDYLLAMDEANLADMQSRCPESAPGSVQLFLDYGDAAERAVPDPYYSGEQGFETVLDLVEAACDGLLSELSQRHFPSQANP